jgi:trehalose synthase
MKPASQDQERVARRLDDYAPVVGRPEIDEIRRLGDHLKGFRLQHVNSTRSGGGVAELLACKVPLLNELGIRTTWDVLEGSPSFFEMTKRLHNALHGADVWLDREAWRVYDETTLLNHDLPRRDVDLVIIHDPQPAGLVQFRSETVKWLWRCHIDLSAADVAAWAFLRKRVERFDAAVFHLPEYTKDLMIPQYLLPPAIDPLSPKNEEMPMERAQAIVAGLGVDPELPMVLQVSRFDYLKDPFGVLEAFRLASGGEPSQLVLAGGTADDDPEGAEVYAKLAERAADVPYVKLLNLPPDSPKEINALQRVARVVVQKSIREGFGLVVAESMWKGKPVIGNAVGGIREQILHGVTGYLVHSTEGMAFRIRQLLTNLELNRQLGEQARENVRANYLLPTSIRRWLGVFLMLQRNVQGVDYLESSEIYR